MPRVRADAAAAPCLRPRGLLHNDAEPVVLTVLLGSCGSPRNSERGVLRVSAHTTFHHQLEPCGTGTGISNSPATPQPLFLLYVSNLFFFR